MKELLKVQNLRKTFKISAKQQKIQRTKERTKVAVDQLSFTAYEGAYTDCNHGAGLAVLHPTYYRHIYKDGLAKFKRFATEVWDISSDRKTDEETARAGIDELERFIREIGLPATLQELGIHGDVDLKAVADSCAVVPGSYRKLTQEEIFEIFKECF